MALSVITSRHHSMPQDSIQKKGYQILKKAAPLTERVDDSDAIEISVYIATHMKEWQELKAKAEKLGKPFKGLRIPRGQDLPRTINITPDLNVLIHFNTNQDPLIGAGTFKKVKYSKMYGQDVTFARATLEVDTLEKMQAAVRELKFLLRLRNYTGIVATITPLPIYTGKAGKKKLSIIQHLYKQGSLQDAIDAGTLTDEDKDSIAADILEGLVNVHGERIIHRDLKPANILLDRQGLKNEMRAAINDFGLSCFAEEDETLGNFCGTLDYHSPEFCQAALDPVDTRAKIAAATTEKHDVWAAGLVLLKMSLNYVLPWEGLPQHEVATFIANLADDWLPKPPEDLLIPTLIWHMLRPNPAERTTAAEALELLEQVL